MMMQKEKSWWKRWFAGVDWIMFIALLPIVSAGLITMTSFVGPENYFEKQLIFLAVSVFVFFAFSAIDWRFLRRTDVLVGLFLFFSIVLLVLFSIGHRANGAQSWFNFGGFSLQPSEMMKIVVILVLAKYFSRRHVEIAHVKHLFISAIYAFIPFFLVFLQPDFGSAIIIFLIWFGMTLVSGISRKHLLIVFGIGVIGFAALWMFVFKDYQKHRISTFLNPYANIQGSGYHVYQSTIAVGSGMFFGKGVGYGTQSRLQFLPKYQTDFIFAAFAEEWGYVGAFLLLLLYGIVVWRILRSSLLGATNFEMLFGVGVAIFLMTHITINVGMNIGLLPVTGITLPFMSYGGSHLLTEFAALGILSGMRVYSRTTHRDNTKNEFLGLAS